MGQTVLRQALQSRVSAAAVYYALVLASFFLPEASPLLLQSSGDQPGISVLEAIDAGARNLSFYQFIAVFLCSLALAHVAFGRGLLRIPPSIRQFSESIARAGVLLCLFAWLKPEFDTFIFFPAAIHAGFFLCKPLHREVSETHAKTALFYSLLTWLSLQWLLPIHVMPIVQASGLFILFGLYSWLSASVAGMEQSMRFRASILAWIATFPFIVAELQYLLYQKYLFFVSPYLIWSILVLIFMVIAFRRKIPAKATEPKINAWLILSIGLGIMSFYRPMAKMPEELFELANRALPLMELHYFRTIPLLEKASSHFVSDYGFGMIYQFIHGYRGLDFLIYDIFDQLIWIITGFLLIKKLIGDEITAFFFVCVFPLADASIPPYYSVALILPLLLMENLKEPTLKKSIWFGLAFTLLLPWRADLSFAWLISLLPLIALMIYKKQLNVRYFIPAGVFTILLIAALIVVSSINHIDWVDSLRKSLQYLSSTDSYALPDLGKQAPSYYVLAHFILPLFISLIALKLIIREILSENKFKYENYLLLFLSVFYLVNLPRGLVRHGHAEGFDNFLLSFAPFVLIVFLGIALFPRRQSRISFVFIGLSIFGLYMRVPLREPEESPAYLAAKQPLKAEMFTAKPEKYRLKADGQSLRGEILPLASWLRSNLKENETFLDMGNTPMLYYYAQKKVPSFFFQSPQNVHSLSMQKEWVKELKETNIPLVLMRHVPESWWDKTDGVPNEIRHYPVFEYLYNHYCFDQVVYGYEVWKPCKEPLSNNIEFENRQLYKYFDLKNLPSLIDLPAVQLIKAELSERNTYPIPENRPEWLEIELESCDLSAQAEITLLKDGNAYGGLYFNINKQLRKEYNIRLSTLYSWWRMKPTELRISIPAGCKIKAINFAKEANPL